MTQSQHTQGPWKINSKITDRALELYPDAPISIASGGNGCGYTAIAQVLCGSRDSAHENKANANLIAAAPELLEALEEASHALEAFLQKYPSYRGEVSGVTTIGNVTTKLRVVIKKAKGASNA